MSVLAWLGLNWWQAGLAVLVGLAISAWAHWPRWFGAAEAEWIDENWKPIPGSRFRVNRHRWLE